MKFYTTINSQRRQDLEENGIKSGHLSGYGYVEVYPDKWVALHFSHPADDIIVELELNEGDAHQLTDVGLIWLLEKDVPPERIRTFDKK